MSARLAVDIGGTFTDVVLETAVPGQASRAHSIKLLTTPDAPERAVLDGVRAILAEAKVAAADVTLVVHGTTLATNALIERKGARTALLTTEGFRDSLEMALGAALRAVRHLHGAARAAGAARPALRRPRARGRRRRGAAARSTRQRVRRRRQRTAPAQGRGGGGRLPAQLHPRGARAPRRRRSWPRSCRASPSRCPARSARRSASTSASRPPSPTPMCCR